MKHVIVKKFLQEEGTLTNFIVNFNTKGKDFGNQDRNSLKLFELNNLTVNIKSFKVPNLINRIAYKFFRKSKAQRSFEYANKLTSLGIGTPQPIAYYEYSSVLLFGKSYYISAHLDYELTYRELVTQPNYKDHENILRAFTRFTYNLHENNVNFLDHSPGNTLIINTNGSYSFYLVDLNRMKFHKMIFEDRMQNFSRLTPKKEMVKIMSDEYAKISGLNFETVYTKMWELTEAFQEKNKRKKRIKKKLGLKK